VDGKKYSNSVLWSKSWSDNSGNTLCIIGLKKKSPPPPWAMFVNAQKRVLHFMGWYTQKSVPPPNFFLHDIFGAEVIVWSLKRYDGTKYNLTEKNSFMHCKFFYTCRGPIFNPFTNVCVQSWWSLRPSSLFLICLLGKERKKFNLYPYLGSLLWNRWKTNWHKMSLS